MGAYVADPSLYYAVCNPHKKIKIKIKIKDWIQQLFVI